MADLGKIEFPGIAQPMGGTYTLSHGITPGAAVIEMAPQPNYVALQGTLRFRIGSDFVEFFDCRPDKASLTQQRGGRVWTIFIYDRRWKWAFGEISGHYNLRNKGGELDAATVKTPHELATLCLDAMGETGYDVSGLPNDPRPEVHWSHENPAKALAELCDQLNTRVVLGLDNLVRLRQCGTGALLPNLQTAMNDDFGFDPAELPDSLRFVGGATRFQAKFTLEAVGRETTGELKLIDDLSYKPADGWENHDPRYFDTIKVNGTEAELKLALSSVFRMYRIKEHVTGDWIIPGYDNNPIDGLRQILPIEDGLTETAVDVQTGQKRSAPTRVTGDYAAPELLYENVTDKSVSVEHSILREEGAVVFNEPLWLFGASKETKPAQLVLEVAFPVKDTDTLEPEAFVLDRNLGGTAGTKPKLVKREDVIRTVRATYSGTPPVAGPPVTNDVTDNLPAEANHYLDAAQAQLFATLANDKQYGGIVAIAPDGAIQQVTWSVTRQGTTTRASRNNEHNPRIPPYPKRRANEKADQAIEKVQRMSEDPNWSAFDGRV